MYQKLFHSDFSIELCSDQRMLTFLLRTELALARSQEMQGILPKGTADSLDKIFNTFQFDLSKIQDDIPLIGNAAAPIISQMIAEASNIDPEAAKYIHLGATSQDIVDTANALKSAEFLKWLLDRVERLEQLLIGITAAHKTTLMIGRTLMQQARPITFGLKTLGWLQGISQSKQQLEKAKKEILIVQLGGAVGSENQYISKQVRKQFADILNLHDAQPWHAQRVPIATFACFMGILSGCLGKIAQDILLLSQTEIGEVSEPSKKGRGSSSTMPHKSNPVLSASILANTHRIPFLVASLLASMPHSHERDAGLWHAEWESMDDLMSLTSGAIEKTIELIAGLEVHTERMKENLEFTNGLIFAEALSLHLAGKIGKNASHALVERLCHQSMSEKKHLKNVAKEMNLDISEVDLDKLFDAKHSIGNSIEIIEDYLNK